MPLYEYQCIPHHHRFEVRHGINETVEQCEVCGQEVRRVIHPVGIVFKGSGFYATDSRQSSKATKPASEAKTEPAAEKKTETKGTAESKAAS